MLEHYKAYFETLVAHPKINKVEFSPIDALLDGLPNLEATDYPVLFVPYYDRSAAANRADWQYDTLSFVVTVYKPFDPEEKAAARHALMVELEQIMNEVAAKIYRDLNDETFPATQIADFSVRGPNPSEPLSPNHLIGWAFEFDVVMNTSITHNPDLWL